MDFLNLPFYLTGTDSIKALAQLKPKSYGDQCISLRDLEFIDPLGLILVLTYLRYYSLVLPKLFLYLPRNYQVRAYLLRSGFLQAAQEYAVFLPAQKPADLIARRDETWLIPLTRFSLEDDVPQLIKNFMTSMHRLMAADARELSQDQLYFCTLLSELCQNIPQHSEDEGFVAAQVYRRKEGRQLHIALGDLGIGLRGSLSKKHDLMSKDEEEIIRYALTQGVSASKEVGRGLGLAQVIKSLQRFNGKFILRSGSGFLEESSKYGQFSQSSFFPGVQIALILNTQ